jgi:(S)-mandelate dehydrogenase
LSQQQTLSNDINYVSLLILFRSNLFSKSRIAVCSGATASSALIGFMRRPRKPFGQEQYERTRDRFPTVASLREHSKRKAPYFAFEYGDGGAGTGNGIKRNRAALDAICIVPQYGRVATVPSTEVNLFGRQYKAPIGIAPMGTPSIVLPGADLAFAAAAQRQGVPYTLGVVGGATIEAVASIAPDVLWFQLYRCGRNDHRIAFDLMSRADAVGVQALMVTLDTPVRTVRPREMAVGLGRSSHFRPTAAMFWQILTHPRWASAFLSYGQPRFANFQKYVGENASLSDMIDFAQREMTGIFTWDELARYRDCWKGPMIAKGIMHPADAEKAVSIGFDGIVVSNHGGRQIEALPAPIDCLPGIVRAVGKKAIVLFDSGIQSGTDVVRALALGARAVFAGKALLWGLGALGANGAEYVLRLLQEETQGALTQIGATSVSHAGEALVIQDRIFRID